MGRVFISHASQDMPLAESVHRWLVGAEHQVFLDQNITDGIAVGDEWEQRLHQQLRWADAVVCIVTSAFAASTWCAGELAIARAHGCRLLPVLAEAGVRHPFRAPSSTWTWPTVIWRGPGCWRRCGGWTL
jgi:hypothetical protein